VRLIWVIIPLIFSIVGIQESFSEDSLALFRDSAASWSQNEISESEFINNIETMMLDNMLIGSKQISDESSIPSWFKNTAGWYSQGKILHSEYVNSIKFLIDSNILLLEDFEKSNYTKFPNDSQFVFHWEQDKTISGYEYSSNINVPLQLFSVNYC